MLDIFIIEYFLSSNIFILRIARLDFFPLNIPSAVFAHRNEHRSSTGKSKLPLSILFLRKYSLPSKNLLTDMYYGFVIIW